MNQLNGPPVDGVAKSKAGFWFSDACRAPGPVLRLALPQGVHLRLQVLGLQFQAVHGAG